MEERTSELARVELELYFLNYLKQETDPRKIVDFKQVVLNVLEPHILVVVWKYLVVLQLLRDTWISSNAASQSWAVLTDILLPIILLFEAVGEARAQVWCAKLSLADTFSASGVFHPALDVRCPHEFVLLVSEVGLLALLHLF